MKIISRISLLLVLALFAHATQTASPASKELSDASTFIAKLVQMNGKYDKGAKDDVSNIRSQWLEAIWNIFAHYYKKVTIANPALYQQKLWGVALSKCDKGDLLKTAENRTFLLCLKKGFNGLVSKALINDRITGTIAWNLAQGLAAFNNQMDAAAGMMAERDIMPTREPAYVLLRQNSLIGDAGNGFCGLQDESVDYSTNLTAIGNQNRFSTNVNGNIFGVIVFGFLFVAAIMYLNNNKRSAHSQELISEMGEGCAV